MSKDSKPPALHNLNKDKTLKYLKAYKNWHLPKNETGRKFINHYWELGKDDHFYKNIKVDVSDVKLTLKHCRHYFITKASESVNTCNNKEEFANLAKNNPAGIQEEIDLNELNKENGKFELGSYSEDTWFRIEIDYSDNLSAGLGDYFLEFDCNSEGQVFIDKFDHPVQHLTAMRDNGFIPTPINLTKHGYPKIITIKTSSIGLYGAGYNPVDYNQQYYLKTCKIYQRNEKVYQKCLRFEILVEMAECLENESIGHEALVVAYNMTRKSEITGEFFDQSGDFFKNNPGARNRVKVFSMGHAHIDSAWLWNYEACIDKCASSWCNTLFLMKKHPEMRFMCSQAQQFEWMKDHFPSLFREIIKMKDRFIPVGGSWVEMDGNLPNGESMVRQFLYGQNFFKEHFGKYCNVFWLPDTFGYLYYEQLFTNYHVFTRMVISTTHTEIF